MRRGPPRAVTASNLAGHRGGPRRPRAVAARGEFPRAVTPPNLVGHRGAPRLRRGAPNDWGSGGHFGAPSKNVHRVARAVGVHVSRRRGAAGDARGGGGAARHAGARARRSRWRLRGRPLSSRRGARRRARAHRQRVDAGRRLAPAGAGRGPRRVPQSLPADHAARSSVRRRASAALPLDDLDAVRDAGSCASPAARTVRWRVLVAKGERDAARGLLDRLVAIFGRDELLRRGPATSRARAGAGPRSAS